MLAWEEGRADPEITVEHDQLYAKLARLEPIIVEDRRPASVQRAVTVLFRRMAAHFAMEEEFAAVAAPQSCGLLQHEHFELLAMLARLREIPPARRDQRERAYRDFVGALARHDAELDVPLFRPGA